MKDLQPVWCLVMRKFIDEFIHDAIDADCPTDKFKRSVIGVAEDEVIAIEVRQVLASNATSELSGMLACRFKYDSRDAAYCRDMIHIRLLHHRRHRILDTSVLKFVICMLIPEQFEIEVWSVHCCL